MCTLAHMWYFSMLYFDILFFIISSRAMSYMHIGRLNRMSPILDTRIIHGKSNFNFTLLFWLTICEKDHISSCFRFHFSSNLLHAWIIFFVKSFRFQLLTNSQEFMVCCRFMYHTSLTLNSFSFVLKSTKRLDWNWHEIEVETLSVVVKSIDGSIYLHTHILGSQLFVSTIRLVQSVHHHLNRFNALVFRLRLSIWMFVIQFWLIIQRQCVGLQIYLFALCTIQYIRVPLICAEEREREQVSHIACRKQLFDVIYLYTTSLVFQW